MRDANGAGAGIRNLVIVCAAGNDGGSDRSISRPHETKNDIVVGNSLTRRPSNGFPGDDIRGIAGSSSRGPAVDGRILPTVVAPGTDVSSALSRTSTRAPIPGTGVADPLNPGTLIDQYLSLTGTSMATPAVSGACALVIDWWRQTRSGQDPSPALVKALLVNTAEDLAGGQNWRGLNRTSVDKALWSLHAGSVFRRTLTYTPDTVLSGSTTLTQVGVDRGDHGRRAVVLRRADRAACSFARRRGRARARPPRRRSRRATALRCRTSPTAIRAGGA